MRAVVAWAVRRRVSVTMTALAVVAFGWVGYERLPLELFPDISYPSLTVQTEFPDTAPQEVENLVTRPVEEAVGVLRGLQTIRSVSRPGLSEVTLEFAWDSDMDMLSLDVREKLDRLILPEGTEDPIVLRFDPSLDPVVRLAVSGPGDLTEVRRLADRRLKPDLETIKGIAAAQVQGGLEEEIHVHVDQERLAALGIPLASVEQVVGVSNVNLPGGALRGQDSQYLIRAVNEFADVEEIADLIVSEQDGRSVRLGDVAEVSWGAREREVITRVNGQEAVEVGIYKEGDANSVSVARALRERLAYWGEHLPEGYRLDVLFDQSRFIEQALREVRNSALLGGLLAVAVLFFFLRDVRSTVIIATSIPLSVIATFVLMYRLDISLNIMSLGGLTLGIGMLVDNSIVVLENIFRKREEGLPLARAAVAGAAEMGPAVTASTLTTVAVFLPIVFVEGIAGQLFADQALTVTISLLASLLVAITVIPMLASLGDRRMAAATAPGAARALAGEATSAADAPDGDAPHAPDGDDRRRPTPAGWLRSGGPGAAGPLSAGGRRLGRLAVWYDGLVRAAVRRPWLTVGLAFALLLLSLGGLSLVGTELIPQMSEGEFHWEVHLPEGTSLAATDRVLQRMEQIAAAEPAIGRHYASVGSRFVQGGSTLNTEAENLGQLNLVLADGADRQAEAEVAERLRSSFAEIPDLEAKFGRPSYFSLSTPVEVVLFGEDLEQLRVYSLELARRLAAIDGLADVRSSLEAGNPELQVRFDRRRLASLGLDMGALSENLRDRVQGVVPTRFKEQDRQIDIRIRNREADRSSIEDVRNLIIPGPAGEPLRLLAVADVTLDRGPAEIHRQQQQRAAVVTGNLAGISLGAAMKQVQAALGEVPPPRGVTAELGGQNREMQVSFASLRFALVLAVFLVYLVMASIFESFLHPLIIMATIPLALVGVAASLLATGTTITVIVLIGVVMLVGIVVNNAIVLIDAINRLRRQGLEKFEAVIAAGHLRLRPILMTTTTTILGLLPMALSWGEGAELRSPLAITVAGGLLVGTLLTLVVIPAAYMAVPSRVKPEAEETPR